MQSVKRLLIDASSLIWNGLLNGKDEENGYEVTFNEKKVFVNSAEHGFEKVMSYMSDTLKKFKVVPSDVIWVIEGANSKTLRRNFHPGYKETRESRPPESYDEFNRTKALLVEAWTAVGAQVCWQDGLEADDVLAYLAKNLQGHRIIITNDKDLSVLVGPGVDVWRRDELSENPFGPFEHKYIPLYIALVGDSSDAIPGAKGFGPKAFLDLLCVFGNEGLDALIDMIERKALDELAENVPELKVLQKVIDSADLVYASWNCALLYDRKVNTLRMPLQWKAGMVKRRTTMTDYRLKEFAGQVKLIHAGNYDEAVKFLKDKVEESPDFAIDIETSTPEESDAWLMEAKGKSSEDDDIGVDVFGSVLTGISITFGSNRQYTFYFTVRHRETDTVKNLDSLKVLEAVKVLPRERAHVVHNSSFELSVLYQEWGALWTDPEWHGFLPNVYDTKLLASYTDENQSKGLKKLSARILDYQQDTYKQVTTAVFDPEGLFVPEAEDREFTLVKEGEMPWPSGRLVAEGDGWEKRVYKMDALTAEHVLSYGADDTICTAALFNHFRILMEIEKTWEVYKEVEILPAYVTALAYCQGTKISQSRLRELEREDDQAHRDAWKNFESFLIEHGWDGTVCPRYEEMTPAAIKEAHLIAYGAEFSTRKRKLDAMAEELDELGSQTLAEIVRSGDVDALNRLVASKFTGKPVINFDSPKQMQRLMYEVLGLPVRIVNKLTPKERETKKDLASAVQKFNKIWQGSKSVELTDEEKELLKQKAASDDTAVDFALAMDADEKQKSILNAMTTIKKVETRRKFYYKPYPVLRHWKDGKIHSSLNQSEAVTRRYSSGGPNLQQLPKKGDGVRVREIIIPHKPNAVICSIDFSGQELRLMAGQSKDKNMLACYIGDKLKDIHSITASGAMVKKWTQEVVDELAEKFGSHLNRDDEDYVYDLFVHLHKKVADDVIHKKADDLRKDAKNVNFAAQFDAQAAKLAQMLIMSVEDAQGFLDAKYAMFPQVETWKDDVRAQLMRDGFVTTMLGARRHLRHAITSDDKWEAERAGRQGPNFKIQGSAAEMTKLAMARVWKSGIQHRLDMVFIAPIHDELCWSVTLDDAMESIKAVHAAMTAPYADLCVPILGSISLGVNFGKQIECGDWIIEERIQSALEKCRGELAA